MGRLEGRLEGVLAIVLKGVFPENRRYLESASEGVLVDVLLARNNKWKVCCSHPYRGWIDDSGRGW